MFVFMNCYFRCYYCSFVDSCSYPLQMKNPYCHSCCYETSYASFEAYLYLSSGFR